ncbi:hypothetical protein [Collinsella aerofaciens]|uniref:hypothetical protein n=1 Tax=Collinsella aerofaciens TaxID=74426 RepID=UPI001EE11BD2|nr:hypothetical protein [Collinsella aerofaciens]MCG5014243.1 hypothetical protein [Collinsella aerofaciens]
MQLSRGSGDNGRTINRDRALRALGLGCVIGAVSKMHRPAADRGRKNDRRDAEWLARMSACRNVVEVWVPDERTEAARALEDACDDLQRAKRRMSKFLLRYGLVFDEATPAGRRGRRLDGGVLGLGGVPLLRRARRRRGLRALHGRK